MDAEFSVESNVIIKFIDNNGKIIRTSERHNKATAVMVQGLLEFLSGAFVANDNNPNVQNLNIVDASTYIPAHIRFGTVGVKLRDRGSEMPRLAGVERDEFIQPSFDEIELQQDISTYYSKITHQVIGFDSVSLTRYDDSNNAMGLLFQTRIPAGRLVGVGDPTDSLGSNAHRKYFIDGVFDEIPEGFAWTYYNPSTGSYEAMFTEIGLYSDTGILLARVLYDGELTVNQDTGLIEFDIDNAINNPIIQSDTTSIVIEWRIGIAALGQNDYVISSSTGVGNVHNQQKEITENGVFTPDKGYTGFSQVTVDVPTEVKNTSLIVTKNQDLIVPPEGYTGFDEVSVKVFDANLQEKSVRITRNGTYTYTPDAEYDGLDKVVATVNVEGGGGTGGISPMLIERTTSNITADMLGDIKTIGTGAFAVYPTLQSIEIPNTVWSINSMAFVECPYMQQITIPGNVKCIGTLLFSSFGSFTGCEGLKTVILEEGIECIGSDTFNGCDNENFTEITLPSSLKYLGNSVFYYCEYLNKVNFSEGIELENIGYDIFYGTKVKSNIFTYSDTKTFNLSFIPVNPDDITVTVNDTSTENFDYDSDTNTITINDSLDEGAEIIINLYGLLKLGDYIFGDESERDDRISDLSGVKNISQNVFDTTYSNAITIPNTMLGLSDIVFKDCQIQGITFEEDSKVKYIGKSALEGTPITSIDLPNSVEIIEIQAFYSCTRLSSVTFGDNIEYIGAAVLNNTLYYDDINNWNNGYLFVKDHNGNNKYLIAVDGEIVSGAITLPSSVTVIAGGCFESATGVTSINLPSNLVSIGLSAIAGNENLEHITIPSSVEKIGAAAFMMCSSLTEITIGSSTHTTFIDFGAFAGCPIETVYYRGNKDDIIISTESLYSDFLVSNEPLFTANWVPVD